MSTLRKLVLLGLAGIILIMPVYLAAQPKQVAAAPDQTVDWYLIGGSGGSVSAGIYSLDSTIGQSVGGDANLSLCSGFLCGLTLGWEIYLPVLSK